ncbi:hypothetical protein JWJ90_11890 [Desulfobulbus rhabdoformis]|jgi:hypothetical protein|uniref:hypothetical protein n=1 Tax=Desulfobulbus rhabdoformis TaxID=34032 RepID=UPI001965E2A2|nr:hypothetical protein [Desulfobulbus rhabdoformis]MBM9614985.1 hypothetical protein [Desulfobulbus rhabdoformis]
MRSIKTGCLAVLITTAIVSLALPVWAGNGKGTGHGGGTRTQSRLKDGSCQKAVEHKVEAKLLAGDVIRDYIRLKKQLKDESCLVDA